MDMAVVFAANYRDIRAYVGRRLGADVADDVTDDVFETALRRQNSFNSEHGTPRVWLFGIANNLVKQHRRDERRHLEVLALVGSGPPGGEDMADVDGRVDSERRSQELARALASLPAGQRDVLLMRAWGDLSDVEIAAALSLRPGTVRSRISRARSRLMQQLGDLEPSSNETTSTPRGNHDGPGTAD